LYWWGKRFLGLSNLVLRRARQFNRQQFPVLLQILQHDQIDHLLLAGDLTTTSLTREFDNFDHTLQKSFPLEQITMVPGNHDRYTRVTVRRDDFKRLFGSTCNAGSFPFIKWPAPDLPLIAFDPCEPTGFSARGQVPVGSLPPLQNLLTEATTQKASTLLFLCHYPGEFPAKYIHREPEHGLSGANELIECLKAFPGKVVWLHGHVHHPWRMQSQRAANILYLNPGPPLLHKHGQTTFSRWILDWKEGELSMEWRCAVPDWELLDE
jgi:predicted phosphodiesterase